MDRMLYLAMSGAKQVMLGQVATSNNLANASTPGFKADLAQSRSMPVFGPGHPSRVYAMTERPGVNLESGPMNTTGRELDMAINGKGWIAVQAADGNEAYTRAGDLKLSSGGLLVTGAGYPVLGNGGGPISIPPSEKLEVGIDGTISIRPVGQAANVLAEIDRIKLVNPPDADLTKGRDGLMRLKSGDLEPADASVRLVSGTLEGSNVNVVGAMVKMIEMARNFEMQIKAMKTVEETDASSDQLMRLA